MQYNYALCCIVSLSTNTTLVQPCRRIVVVPYCYCLLHVASTKLVSKAVRYSSVRYTTVPLKPTAYRHRIHLHIVHRCDILCRVVRYFPKRHGQAVGRSSSSAAVAAAAALSTWRPSRRDLDQPRAASAARAQRKA